MADTLKATPRDALLGIVADLLMKSQEFGNRARIPEGVPLLGGSGVGDVLLGAAPAEVNEWSYGNSPLRINPNAGRTASFVPEIKPGRQQGVADVGLTLLGAGGAKKAAPVVKKGLIQAGDNLAAPRKLNTQRGIFMGDLSKTWNKEAAAKAQKMEKAGADARAIWKETGTFKGPDGKWRQEIDDSAALFNATKEGAGWREDALTRGHGELNFGPTVGNGGLMRHSQLEEAYGKDLPRNTYIKNKNTMLGDGPQGSYDDKWSQVTLYAPQDAATAKSTTLHELQHAVQQRQGFAQGGNPNMTRPDSDEIAAMVKSLEAKADAARDAGDRATYMAASNARAALLREDGFGGYKRLAGEAEARAVQARMNLTPEQRRGLFPLDSYDVPVDELIMRGASDGPQMSRGLLDDAAMPAAMLRPEKYNAASAPKVQDGFVRLFRAESPTTKFDDVFDRGGLQEFASAKDGTRFTDDLKYADYFRSSYGKDAELKYVDVPKAIAENGRLNDFEFKIRLP